MAYPKEERNKEFLAAWQRGTSNMALAEAFNLTLGGVKALKQRLRVKDPSLYVHPSASKPAIQQPGKVVIREERPTRPAKQQASKLAEYKKVTYYLEPSMAKDIKRLALDRDMDISELIREVLGGYLKNK